MNYLPSKLLKLRKHYNYSQAHVAEVLGIDVVEYMAYENGREVLNYAQCKKIANLYHIGVTEIFRNSDEVTLYEVSNAHTDELNIEYFIPKKNVFDYLKEFIKNNSVLVGITAGVVILGILAFIIFGNRSEVPYEITLTNINRLSVSDTTVVYIYGDGAVKGSGDNANGQLSNLPSSNAIKVAEGKDFTIVLNNDGTIFSSGLSNELEKEISDWKNIVDIAAGDNHVLGVNSRGVVYAIGDNTYGQCDVSGTRNIKKVFASKNGSILLDGDGNLSSSGEFIGSSKIEIYENVIDFDTSDDNLVVLDKDGAIECITKKKNFLNIYKWKDVVDVCCGDEFIAALLKDGTVLIDCDDKHMEKAVSEWNNIIVIDAGNDYLIAYDGEKIYGAGNNEYHQFEREDYEKETLSQVSNVKISIGDTIDVSFDSVENATGYEIKMNVGEANIKKVATNQTVSFFTDGLNIGDNYQITITTLGDDDYYADSSPLDVVFTYLKPEKNSEEYVDININFIGMDEESFKSYLASIGVTNIICVETGNPCEGDKQTIISVDGITTGQRIVKRDLANAMVTYYTCKIPEPVEETNNEQDLEN